MSRFQPEQTVASVVATAPETSRVFERHGIDYCCGGKIPLQDACARRGVAPDLLLQELEAAAGPGAAPQRVWGEGEMGELVDHILATHHAFVKREIPRLSALVDKVHRVHGDTHPDTLPELARTWHAWAQELALHLEKEEMVLFPALKNLAAGRPFTLHCGLEGPISMMEWEHDQHGLVLARLRALTGGYVPPPEACGSWRALWSGLEAFERDLHQHVHLENNVLFPMARARQAPAVGRAGRAC